MASDVASLKQQLGPFAPEDEAVLAAAIERTAAQFAEAKPDDRFARKRRAYLRTRFVKAVLDMQDPIGRLLRSHAVAISGSMPPLSERAYVERLLKFVSDSVISAGERLELQTGIDLGADRELNETTVYTEGALDELHDDLSSMLSDPDRARSAITTSAFMRFARETVALPSISADGKLTFRYLFHHIEGALFFALLLLLDESKPFFGMLSRCRYRECGRFFLPDQIKERGPLKREYCCDDHRKTEQRLGTAERVADHRRKKATEKAAKSRRKHK